MLTDQQQTINGFPGIDCRPEKIEIIKNPDTSQKTIKITPLGKEITSSDLAKTDPNTEKVKVHFRCEKTSNTVEKDHPFHESSTPHSNEQLEYAKKYVQTKSDAINNFKKCASGEPMNQQVCLPATKSNRICFLNEDGKKLCLPSVDDKNHKENKQYCTSLNDKIAIQEGKLIKAKNALSQEGFLSTLWGKVPESVQAGTKWVAIIIVVACCSFAIYYFIKNDKNKISLLLFKEKTNTRQAKEKIINNILNDITKIQNSINEINHPTNHQPPLHNLPAQIIIPAAINQILVNRQQTIDTTLQNRNAETNFSTNIQNNIIAPIQNNMQQLNARLTAAAQANIIPAPVALPVGGAPGQQINIQVATTPDKSLIEKVTAKKIKIEVHINNILLALQGLRDWQNQEDEDHGSKAGFFTKVLPQSIKWGLIKPIKWSLVKPIEYGVYRIPVWTFRNKQRIFDNIIKPPVKWGIVKPVELGIYRPIKWVCRKGYW